MKFLVDNQLPAALSRYLSSSGCDCKHVEDAGLAAATDAEIWRYANENECTVISKDEYFLFLANASESRVRLGNCRTPVLLAAFERLWPRVEVSLKAGDRVVELR